MAGGGAKASKKAEKKKKEKLIEDRTFGLKNKNKSKVVQKYVNMVEKTVNNPQGRTAANTRKEEKLAKQEKEAELALLFKNVEGDKKKKKSAWDDLKGGKKKEDKPEEEEEEEDIPEVVLVENNDQLRDLENEIDEERKALPPGGTPLTLERFMQWKEKRVRQKTKQKIKDGKMKKKVTTGKELFLQNAQIFVDDEKADNSKYKREEEEDDKDAYFITDSTFKAMDPAEFKKMMEKKKAEEAKKKAEEEEAKKKAEAEAKVEVDEALFAAAAEEEDLDGLDED
mmetsp:Transcript_6483/g.16088  ORF Transcript_6483/g.16088 Transcript_6483/m.16088 type:complete len:283 (-) Transcript_6483:210-1058(-)